MSRMMTVSPEPIATLEIGEGRLPPRMMASRLRADLPRPVPLAAMPRRRLRLAMLLLMMAVPVVSATRRRRPA